MAMDDATFESLFRDYQSAVYGWIVRIVRDRGAAEELTIDTFWRIYRARARFDPSRPFGAWARRIATNCAYGHLKRNRLRGAPPPPAAQSRDLPMQLDARNKITKAFDALPPRLRIAATLALIEELPYAEIAEALGISVNGVKSRVFRATRLMRQTIERMQ